MRLTRTIDYLTYCFIEKDFTPYFEELSINFHAENGPESEILNLDCQHPDSGLFSTWYAYSPSGVEFTSGRGNLVLCYSESFQKRRTSASNREIPITIHT